MSRIYWDSMLFIYWLEGNQMFSERVRSLLEGRFGGMINFLRAISR